MKTRKKNISWKENRILLGLFPITSGILLNLCLASMTHQARLPIFLDSVGTIFASVLGGYLPGVIVALASNLFVSFFEPYAAYYGIINVACAVCTVFFMRKDLLKNNILSVFRFILFLAFLSGTIGTVLTLCLDDFLSNARHFSLFAIFYGKLHLGSIVSQWLNMLAIHLLDKAVVVLVAIMLSVCFPENMRDKFYIRPWGQKPLSAEEKAAAIRVPCKGFSLGSKFVILLTFASFLLAFIATAISLYLFREYTRNQYAGLAQSYSRLAASAIHAENVENYLKFGRKVEDYQSTERFLHQIKASNRDIQFLYVYKFMEDGCHVVFDLDSEDVKGSPPGQVDPYDESFMPYVPDLIQGKKIDPIITNDVYGWLLTALTPVYGKNGQCICYAAVDIEIADLVNYEKNFLVKLVTLFLGFYVLIVAVGIWFAQYNIVLPINTIALCTSAFAYNNEVAREENVEKIRNLDIRTGDEIENLYHAIVRTSEDSMLYMQDLHEKTDLISSMQSGLIMVLADMVENRDGSTGDHVRRTAAYTAVIMKEMRKKGYYKNLMTDRFVLDVEQSAPLHDIGKIQVPDAILKKPGKLTEEEFEIMKTHTTAGAKILERAIKNVPGAEYLKEAKNLAAYHHEKWNGKGYPEGLSGSDIPLSARIMAVADVFDALISKRVYKDAFSFEEAMEIIKRDSGSHFDPKIVDAFVSGEEEVRQIAEKFNQ